MILRNVLFQTIIVRNLKQKQQQCKKNKIIKCNKFVQMFVLYCGMFLIFNNFIQITKAQQLNDILQKQQQQQQSNTQPAINEDTQNTQNPEEIQKAVCTITAGEVKASAEAITTKTLKGVCGAAEMQLALSKLEMRILQELKELKTFLIQQLKIEMKEEPTTSKPHVNVPMTKSLHTQAKPREDEVKKFNNTLLADRDIKLFTYYWKLENFSAHISSSEMHNLESPVFTIKGKPLQIKANFQHFQRDFLFLQLQYASTSTASKKNIWLEMGMEEEVPASLFKEIISENKMEFKHKISILDQHNRQAKDLISQEFNNLDNGLLVPNSALIGGTSPYIKNDALLIQIFLYL